jgi:hypothetical protein
MADQKLRAEIIQALKCWRQSLKDADELKQLYMDAKEKYTKTLTEEEKQ